METTNFYNTVLELYRENKWREILQLNDNSDNLIARKLLWVWPSEENLTFLKNIVTKYQLEGISSIGCGCGLLEWIINKSTGLPILGYEVNKQWWTSKYSNPQFIELQFNDPPDKLILQSHFALFFCYFNNGPAFKQYVNSYNGTLIVIIGPGDGCDRYTDPEPFNPNFGENNFEWKLSEYQQIKQTKDFIAVYVRNKQYS